MRKIEDEEKGIKEFYVAEQELSKEFVFEKILKADGDDVNTTGKYQILLLDGNKQTVNKK